MTKKKIKHPFAKFTFLAGLTFLFSISLFSQSDSADTSLIETMRNELPDFCTSIKDPGLHIKDVNMFAFDKKGETGKFTLPGITYTRRNTGPVYSPFTEKTEAIRDMRNVQSIPIIPGKYNLSQVLEAYSRGKDFTESNNNPSFVFKNKGLIRFWFNPRDPKAETRIMNAELDLLIAKYAAFRTDIIRYSNLSQTFDENLYPDKHFDFVSDIKDLSEVVKDVRTWWQNDYPETNESYVKSLIFAGRNLDDVYRSSVNDLKSLESAKVFLKQSAEIFLEKYTVEKKSESIAIDFFDLILSNHNMKSYLINKLDYDPNRVQIESLSQIVKKIEDLKFYLKYLNPMSQEKCGPLAKCENTSVSPKWFGQYTDSQTSKQYIASYGQVNLSFEVLENSKFFDEDLDNPGKFVFDKSLNRPEGSLPPDVPIFDIMRNRVLRGSDEGRYGKNTPLASEHINRDRNVQNVFPDSGIGRGSLSFKLDNFVCFKEIK